MKFSYKAGYLLATGAIASLLFSAAANAVQSVDPTVPSYEKASGISGNLSSVGSDTLANLMTMWA